MIRRHQLNRPSLLSLRALQVLGVSGSIRGVALLSLASFLALSATVSAQNTPGSGGDRIDFVVPSDQPTLVPLESDLELSIQDEPGSFVIWEHGASPCCGDCPPTWRVRAEALLLDYEANSSVTLSDHFGFHDFGYEEGGRVSLVRRLDCLDAWEIAYVGPFEWSEAGQVIGVGLMSQLSSTTGVNLSEFNNATFHGQAYRGRLNSVEVNRRWYGWDVISTLAGVRYMNAEENYLFNSIGAAGGTGSLEIDMNNHMVGPQVGMELKYPLGNWMTSATLKGAIMFNGANNDFTLVNAGVVEVSTSDNNAQFASIIEMGVAFSYQVTPHIAFRGGYEFWWLYGYGAVPGQLANTITRQTGSDSHTESDAIFHGATVGIEAVW